MIWGLVGDSKESACYRKKRERKKENVLIVQFRISSTLAAEDERKLIRLKRLSRILGLEMKHLEDMGGWGVLMC